jgi:nitrate/nitrite transporter NarK
VGGVGVSLFRILFSKELGLSLEETGEILKWCSLVSLVLCYPLGWLADKIHPPRLYLISVAITLAVAIASTSGIHSKGSFAVYTVLWVVAVTINGAANGPLFPSMLPKGKFGQFASAASLVNAGMLVLANYFIGVFIDYVGTYRAIYWWSTAFTVMALLFSCLMYRGWLRHGGDRAYVAPLPNDV